MKALRYTVKHLMILLVGVVFAVVFALITYSSKDFSASVLSLQEREFVTKAQWDVAYKKNDQQVEVFISESLQQYNQLFVSFLFSSSEIHLDVDGISSPYSFEILSFSNSSLVLRVDDFWEGNIDEWIIIIPFEGDQEDITVEFVSDLIQWGQFFAVGVLRDFDMVD